MKSQGKLLVLGIPIVLFAGGAVWYKVAVDHPDFIPSSPRPLWTQNFRLQHGEACSARVDLGPDGSVSSLEFQSPGKSITCPQELLADIKGIDRGKPMSVAESGDGLRLILTASDFVASFHFRKDGVIEREVERVGREAEITIYSAPIEGKILGPMTQPGETNLQK